MKYLLLLSSLLLVACGDKDPVRKTEAFNCDAGFGRYEMIQRTLNLSYASKAYLNTNCVLEDFVCNYQIQVNQPNDIGETTIEVIRSNTDCIEPGVYTNCFAQYINKGQNDEMVRFSCGIYKVDTDYWAIELTRESN